MSNTEWRFFRRNPKGWVCFCAQRRYHSFMQNDYTSLILPCWAQKQIQQSLLD
jgi:hypothetical protein